MANERKLKDVPSSRGVVDVLGDDVLCKILARLPGEPLLEFRLVSKHWNRLISDPSFMKLRSRRMVFLPFPRPLVVLDDNVQVKDKAHSMVPVQYQPKDVVVTTAGTFNGLVLLALTNATSSRCELMLYNPLTFASMRIMVMDIPTSFNEIPYVFGFGDDFKIVRFGVVSRHSSTYTCDVFDLKTSSWSTRPQYLVRDFHFSGDAGLFLNGFLYWAISSSIDGIVEILALNVKETVFSRIKLPVQIKRMPLLGSIDGCLCMVHTFQGTRSDLWVRKEQGRGVEISWLKARSFTIQLEACQYNRFCPICVLGNGKILFTNMMMLLVMYDTSKDSYEVLDGLLTFEPTYSSLYSFKNLHSIEYVESLVSPFDIC